MTRFVLWSFYKGVLEDDHLSKTILSDWFQEWLSYTGLTVLVFWAKMARPQIRRVAA